MNLKINQNYTDGGILYVTTSFIDCVFVIYKSYFC